MAYFKAGDRVKRTDCISYFEKTTGLNAEHTFVVLRPVGYSFIAIEEHKGKENQFYSGYFTLVKNEAEDAINTFDKIIKRKEENKMEKTNLPSRYIINKFATVLFWEDGEKTIVKKSKDDAYDKRLGFLYAYFQKTSGLSRNKANDFIQNLIEETNKEEKIKQHKQEKETQKIVRTVRLIKQNNIYTKQLHVDFDNIAKAYLKGLLKGSEAAKKVNMTKGSFYYHVIKNYDCKTKGGK